MTAPTFKFLGMGDIVNWIITPGLPARQVNVIGIQFADQPGNQRLTLVRWKDVKYCIVQLDNGKAVSGSEIEPLDKPVYHYPDADRCN